MHYLLIALGVVARLVPHAWNVTPIGAIGLFAGANGSPRTAWLVPLTGLAIGDAILGFYDPVVMAAVYLGFAAGPFIGRAILGRHRSLPRYGTAVLCGATTFFVVSNFGVWIVGYPHTLDGLIDCYVRAIPYYGATLGGDAVYAAILFGAPELFGWQPQRRDHAAEG